MEETQQLLIKNMVCNRCVMAVEEILLDMGIEASGVRLGQVYLKYTLSHEQKEVLRQQLRSKGFELLGGHKQQLVEQIKNFIINHIHHQETLEQKVHWSVIIGTKMGYDYAYLGRVFNELEGVTIGQYIIAQKVEKAKELLAYQELTLSEIAWKLGYSSVPHLSKQFKQVAGLSPSEFKRQKMTHLRKPLDEV